MPNHISNRLEVNANSIEELNSFLEDIKGNEKIDGVYPDIDFNKIIPMPEELRDTEASSMTDDSIYYYLVKTGQEELVSRILRHPAFYTMDRFNKYPQEKLNTFMATGEKYVNIFLKYGAKDWYDWSKANWGTKWNAYNTNIVPSLDGFTATIYFQTAWNGVPDIIATLTEKYPDLTFDYAYADEDMGSNCGEGYGEDGEFTFRYVPSGDDAMELFIKAWDYDADDFYQDDDGEWHNREWEEDEDNEEDDE